MFSRFSILFENIQVIRRDEVVKKVDTSLTIVTASCNKITLWTDLPAALSLQIEGVVTWVGRSSMVKISLFYFHYYE
jgi:hypothetical protein